MPCISFILFLLLLHLIVIVLNCINFLDQALSIIIHFCLVFLSSYLNLWTPYFNMLIKSFLNFLSLFNSSIKNFKSSFSSEAVNFLAQTWIIQESSYVQNIKKYRSPQIFTVNHGKKKKKKRNLFKIPTFASSFCSLVPVRVTSLI